MKEFYTKYSVRGSYKITGHTVRKASGKSQIKLCILAFAKNLPECHDFLWFINAFSLISYAKHYSLSLELDNFVMRPQSHSRVCSGNMMLLLFLLRCVFLIAVRRTTRAIRLTYWYADLKILRLDSWFSGLLRPNFYPPDVHVSAVFATAKWLAGWMSHAGIVSIWLNLS